MLTHHAHSNPQTAGRAVHSASGGSRHQDRREDTPQAAPAAHRQAGLQRPTYPMQLYAGCCAQPHEIRRYSGQRYSSVVEAACVLLVMPTSRYDTTLKECPLLHAPGGCDRRPGIRSTHHTPRVCCLALAPGRAQNSARQMHSLHLRQWLQRSAGCLFNAP
jgi:hypothetical protein